MRCVQVISCWWTELHVERSRSQTLAFPRSWMTTTMGWMGWTSHHREQALTGTRHTRRYTHTDTHTAFLSRCMIWLSVVQVPSSRVFRGGQGASKDLQQGGCLVGGSDLLPVSLRTKGGVPRPNFLHGWGEFLSRGKGRENSV